MPRFMHAAINCIPANFQAPHTSVQPICPLLEVCFYWKVSFGAHGLSVVQNSDSKCIGSAGLAVGVSTVVCYTVAI